MFSSAQIVCWSNFFLLCCLSLVCFLNRAGKDVDRLFGLSWTTHDHLDQAGYINKHTFPAAKETNGAVDVEERSHHRKIRM